MKTVAIVIGVVLLIILGAFIAWLFLNPASLAAARDLSIIFLAFLSLIAVILIGVMAGMMVWLIILLRDRVIPLLDQGKDTAETVKGTVNFVGENVASPIIKVASAAAGARGVVKGLVGRKS